MLCRESHIHAGNKPSFHHTPNIKEWSRKGYIDERVVTRNKFYKKISYLVNGSCHAKLVSASSKIVRMSAAKNAKQFLKTRLKMTQSWWGRRKWVRMRAACHPRVPRLSDQEVRGADRTVISPWQ